VLTLLLALIAGAAPPPAAELPWLPIDGDTAVVRLAPGLDPMDPDLAPLLEGAHQVGAGQRLFVDRVLAGRPDLRDPRRCWIVAIERLPALRAAGAVELAWGRPEPAPPPDDIPPTTPDFDPAQRFVRAPPEGIGSAWTATWPGADGAGVWVANVEYDFDPEHEALLSNPPERGPGEPLGRFDFHGNAVFGLVGSGADGFGITGIAPAAGLRIVYPFQRGTYDLASAILLAAEGLTAGDVLLIEQQTGTRLGLGPVSADPATFDAIAVAVASGLHVVEPAGNGGVDLDSPVFEGWFSLDNDSGAILVAAAEHPSGELASYSGFGSRIDLRVPVGDAIAPSSDDGPTDLFFPGGDRRQAYTADFSGTSGASAIVAGAIASLQGISRELYGAADPPSVLRDRLRLAGRAQLATSEPIRPAGAPLDLRRYVALWLAP